MLPLLSTPWALAALAALPTLTAIYWMRHSYRRVAVSSLILWRDPTESSASGLRLRQLQTPILFFLELAALALLALAASGPRLVGGQGTPPLIVVLDDSLSMQAGGDASPRRRAEAVIEREFRWIGTFPVRFLTAGTQPRSLGEATTSWSEAKARLAGWQCRAPRANLAEAVVLAGDLGGDSCRILVLTDRPPAADATLPGRVVWRALGQPLPNVAIIRASRKSIGDDDRCAIEIANYADVPRTATLVIRAAGAEASRQSLDLGPGEVRRIVIRAASAAPMEARLLESDALDLDNAAFLVRDAAPLVRTDIRIKDPALRSLVDKALGSTKRTAPTAGGSDLVITDGLVPTDNQPDVWVVQLTQEKDADAFVGPFVLDRTHPLTTGLDLQGIAWGAGRSHDFSGDPVVLAGNVPLLTVSKTNTGQRLVRIRLRPDLSTLPQSPAWPVLIWNLLQWRAAELPGIERANIALGESLRMTLATPKEAVRVTAPSGEARTVAVRGRAVVVATSDIGVHRIDDPESTFAVSVVNADESDLRAAAEGSWGEWPAVHGAAPGVTPLSWIFALAALAVLTLHLWVGSRTN